ncbi:hypothetical protein RUM43_012057 [Polyplax serrata]|uniref:Peptidase M12B domain-containing protein n=1 Tax=Polyplax serrata TaxID=468196 RepID=A0AAN8NZ50_POLSC
MEMLQLLAPNLVQKHYLQNGAEQIAAPEIEHCYYHGTVKDYPGAAAAFHTCNGVSGVIHIGNETFVIHPFYGGDLSQKHPHVIFEARTKQNKGCANSGNLDWRKNSRKTKHVTGLMGDPESILDARYRRNAEGSPLSKLFGAYGTEKKNSTGDSKIWDRVSDYSKLEDNRWFDEYVLKNAFEHGVRFKRDVREATKYVETALVLDKAMFEKRNGSTRSDVIHDAIQVANIADLVGISGIWDLLISYGSDLYYRALNTRISIVYIETWQSVNKVTIDKNQDISRALLNFNDYTSRKMFKIDKDTSQLLTSLYHIIHHSKNTRFYN